MEKINISESFRMFDKYWQSKMIGEFNSCQVKVAKMRGDFDWHYHTSEDELYLIVKGSLNIKFRDSEITLKDGELGIVDKGIEHKLVADEEVQVITIEPVSTQHKTGKVTKGKPASDSDA